MKSPFVLVVDPKLPIKSVPELIKYAKESATPMNYSSAGVGSSQHLSMEYMAQRFGLKMTHVPYRNSPQAITDIAAGHVNLGFAEAGASLPLIRDGKLRALAVSVADAAADPARRAAVRRGGRMRRTSKRCPGTSCSRRPPPRRRSSTGCTRRCARSCRTPEMKKRAADIGLLPLDSPSIDGIKDYIKSEQEKWGTLVRSSGWRSQYRR